MAVGAIVVGIVTALLLATPGLGGLVQVRWQCLFASRAGDGGACEAIARAGDPERACTTSITSGSASAGVRVAMVDIEGGTQVLIRETADGKVHVTFIDEGSVGVSGRLGADGGIEAGDVQASGRAQATIGAAIGGEGGDTRVFDDPAGDVRIVPRSTSRSTSTPTATRRSRGSGSPGRVGSTGPSPPRSRTPPTA